VDDERPRDGDQPPPRDDDTQALDLTIGDDPPRWTASAPVPVAEPPTAPPTAPADEVLADEYPDPTADRNWLTPLLYGFLGLVLLGVLLAGIWLISKADDDGGPAPTASPTAPPFTAAPGPVATTKQPTRPAPTVTTGAPGPTTRPEPPTQPEPTLAPDGSVPVPAVVGLAEDEARQRLSDAGLRFEVTRQPDADHAPGTVLSVSPGPGTSVASNSVVRLVVASAPQDTP
jgi:hypothetical protein